jgi:hypothetical protein
MSKYPSQTPEANRARQQKFISGKKRLHMNLTPKVFDLFKEYAENSGFTLAEALEKLLANQAEK